MPLFINQGTSLSPVRYTVNGDDKLYFALMEENQSFEDAILKRVYDENSDKTKDGDIIVKFLSADTENLRDGRYKYTMKLQKYAGTSYNVHTVIPECDFIING